jgi:flagellar hook-length control protein FliK
MMQHVATAKSEVAAFATDNKSSSFTGSESNEQFSKLLQDQKSLNTLADASDNAQNHTLNKKAALPPHDVIRRAEIAQKKSASNMHTENQDVQTTKSLQDNAAMQSANEGNNGLKTENTKAELELDLSTKHDDIDSTTIIAHEWVSLVDNLQKLANIADKPLVDTEVQDIDVSLADLTLSNNVEKGLLGKVADSQMTGKLNMAIDEIGLSQVEDIKVDQNISTLIDEVLGEVLSNPENDGLSESDVRRKVAELLLEHPEILQDLISKLKIASQENGTDSASQQTLEITFNKDIDKDLINVINKDIDKDIDKDVIKLINKDIDKDVIKVINKDIDKDVIKVINKDIDKDVIKVINKDIDQDVSKVINKDIDQDVSKVINKDIDQDVNKVIDKDILLANQQFEADGKANLTLSENKALLRALLTDLGVEKTHTPEKLVQAIQAETLITKLDSEAVQGELLEQDVQAAQVTPSNLLSNSNPEKVTSNVDIKKIINWTDNKVDKVLENIALRVFDSKTTVEPISPEQTAQLIVIPKVAEIISSVETSSKEFISALKSGLEEFKNQLSQGREPGLDLKALVSDALAKTSDKDAIAKPPINLEQMVKNVSQVLDFAQTINRAIDHHQDQTYNVTLKDVAQIQGEQSKQIQLNQLDAKFEKAINITKSEGHQQLAEKVRWMVNTKNLVAEIRLDPAELGSVNVKVALSGESVTVNFVVQSQQARDAVDNATPKLREMLAEKGIELGQSSVNQENNGQQGQGDDELSNQAGRGQDDFENVDVPEQVFAQQNIVNGALGGIDYFV